MAASCRVRLRRAPRIAALQQESASDWKSTPARTLIIATEDGVFHQIHQRAPEEELIQAPGIDESCACNQCPYMRLNTLEKLYLCLRNLEPEVTVPEPIRQAALRPIDRMLALS
jgi:quinolinate synthase